MLRNRVTGAVTIVVGAAIVGFDPNRWDVRILHIPFRSGHGVHARDVLGMVLIAVGIAVLWHAPPRR